MMKKPIPRWPSAAITSPAENVRSLNVRASSSASFFPRSEKRGTPRTSSIGALTRGILLRAGGLRSVHAARQLLDPSLRGVELRHARLVELFPALPERDRLVEPRAAALQPLDDLLELALGVFEGRLRHRISSTEAANAPAASCTSTRSPRTSAVASRTSRPSRRTIAYPRPSVARGDRARSLPATCSIAARRRSSASCGARSRRVR